MLTQLLFISDRMTPCLLLSIIRCKLQIMQKTNIIHFYQLSRNPFYVSHTRTNSMFISITMMHSLYHNNEKRWDRAIYIGEACGKFFCWAISISIFTSYMVLLNIVYTINDLSIYSYWTCSFCYSLYDRGQTYMFSHLCVRTLFWVFHFSFQHVMVKTKFAWTCIVINHAPVKIKCFEIIGILRTQHIS